MRVCFYSKICRLPYFKKAAPWIFVISLLMVLAVIPFGRESHGAKRWIYIGPISFQPAELVKISVIIMAAAKMCASGTKIKNCHR